MISYVGTDILINYLAQENCSYTVVGSGLGIQHMVLATPKGVNYAIELDDALFRLKNRGILKTISDKYIHTYFLVIIIKNHFYALSVAYVYGLKIMNECTSSSENERKVSNSISGQIVIYINNLPSMHRWFARGCLPTEIAASLEFNDFLGLFMITIIGLVLALLCALIEVIQRKVTFSRQRVKAPKLKFGNVYKGMVSRITPDGIWVQVASRAKDFFVKNQNLNPSAYGNFTAWNLNIKENEEVWIKYFGKDESGQKRFTLRAIQGEPVPMPQTPEQQQQISQIEHIQPEGAIEMQNIGQTAIEIPSSNPAGGVIFDDAPH